MRIISGSLKGRRLNIPKASIEPTKDSVKEALFNIIGNGIINKSFLDLYAGSGSIGIEALSRGAANVTLVDKQSICINTIRDNLAYISEVANTIKGDVFHFIKSYSTKFDYIFADPPYNDDIHEVLLKLLANSSLLSSNTIIIVEHRIKKEIVNIPFSFSFIDKRRYGITGLLFLTLAKPNIKSKPIQTT